MINDDKDYGILESILNSVVIERLIAGDIEGANNAIRRHDEQFLLVNKFLEEEMNKCFKNKGE